MVGSAERAAKSEDALSPLPQPTALLREGLHPAGMDDAECDSTALLMMADGTLKLIDDRPAGIFFLAGETSNRGLQLCLKVSDDQRRPRLHHLAIDR